MARVYATATQLAAWLGDYPPLDAVTLLARASLVVDEVLLGAYYAVDDQGMPTAASVQDALADAVCAQVAWWLQPSTAMGQDRLQRQSRPDTSMGGTSMRPDVAPDAMRVLAVAGLCPTHPWAIG